jgi:hypothetical protein
LNPLAGVASGSARILQIIACTAEQCVCGNCRKETTLIGYGTAEQLDVEPAKYFVRVAKREKRACKGCEDQGVQSAPLPPRIIEKGLASDRVVIDTVTEQPLAPIVPISIFELWHYVEQLQSGRHEIGLRRRRS